MNPKNSKNLSEIIKDAQKLSRSIDPDFYSSMNKLQRDAMIVNQQLAKLIPKINLYHCVFRDSPVLKNTLKAAQLNQRLANPLLIQINQDALNTVKALYLRETPVLSVMQEINRIGAFNNLSQIFAELNQYQQIWKESSKNFVEDFDDLSLAISDATRSKTFTAIIENPEAVEAEDVINDSHFEKLLRLAKPYGIEPKDIVEWIILLLTWVISILCSLYNDGTNITINNQITICPSSEIPLQQEPDATFEEVQSNPALKSEDV